MCNICVMTLSQGLQLQRCIRPTLHCIHLCPGVILSNLVVHIRANVTVEHRSTVSPNSWISTEREKHAAPPAIKKKKSFWHCNHKTSYLNISLRAGQGRAGQGLSGPLLILGSSYGSLKLICLRPPIEHVFGSRVSAFFPLLLKCR